MEIGISTATFFGKCVTENSFDIIRSFGVKLAEVFLTTFYEYESEFGDLLRSKSEDIKVHSIHTLNSQFEPQLFNGAERTRKDAEFVFRKALANGQKLGAKFYTFHGTGMLKKKSYKYDLEKLSANVNGLLDITNEYGITLSFENVHWAMYHYPGFYSGLKKYCPNLKGTLDIKQAFQSGEDYKLFLKDMGRDISTVHICDYKKDGRLCSIGEGDFNFKELIHVLKEEGIDVPIIIELYSGDYEDFSKVAESVKYIKSLL